MLVGKTEYIEEVDILKKKNGNKYLIFGDSVREGVAFAGGQEMKIFSTVFRDFGKNMVGKRYFQHGAGFNNEKITRNRDW